MLSLRNSALLLVLMLLSGCGFHPLNLSQTGQTVVENIYIPAIPDRRGQLLRQELIQKMTHGAHNKMARFHVRIAYEESQRNISVTRENTQGRNEVGAVAKFSLYDHETQKVIFESQATSFAGYSIGDQVAFSAYSSLVAEQGLREKLIPHVAEDIAQQVRVFFEKHPQYREHP